MGSGIGVTDIDVGYRTGKHYRRGGKDQLLYGPPSDVGDFYKKVGGKGNIFYDLMQRGTSPEEMYTHMGNPGRMLANFTSAFEREAGGREGFVPFDEWYQGWMEGTYLPSLFERSKQGERQAGVLQKGVGFINPSTKQHFANRGQAESRLGSILQTYGKRGEGEITYDPRRAIFDAVNAYAIQFGLMPEDQISYGRGPGISGMR
jgi:hypothetical protein